MTRDEYETNARRLIGNTITKVVYHEIDYRDNKFHFFDDPRFDSLDFGLELELGTGQFLSITWGSEFYQYGVSLIDGRFSTVAPQSRFLDVSETKRWKTLLGRPIESVDVSWSWSEKFSKPKTPIDYPQDVLLQFEGEQARVISALEIREKNSFMGMMDHITVFDDLEIARKFKCLEDM